MNQIALKLRTLVIFRKLLDDDVMRAFLNLADASGDPPAERVDRYAAFVHRLFEREENFTRYVWRLISSDENAYVRRRARREPISETLESCVERELTLLQEISCVAPTEMLAGIAPDMNLPVWATDSAFDFRAAYAERMDRVLAVGYGIYADYAMFTFRGGDIAPVKTPDRIRLSSLTGYAREREALVKNTLAFWEDKPVANALLYGDAGTGKSSTVKAIVNEFADRGLRLVEVRKGDLLEIPDLVERLADNPLRFIVFVDDLSFAQGNEEIGALKAILEGSVSSKTANVAIYVTSNRRHLVKETFSERSGDDIHLNETMQEMASLSERFGLAVLFSKPSKDRYLEIARALAREYGLDAIENFDLQAEQYAIERGGRSGRTARQFAEYMARMK